MRRLNNRLFGYFLFKATCNDSYAIIASITLISFSVTPEFYVSCNKLIFYFRIDFG